MRGEETQRGAACGYVSAEERSPRDHPLRAIRRMADEPLEQMGPAFEARDSWAGRPSLPPEWLLRVRLLQAEGTIRGERLLMEQRDYKLLFRRFVGMDLDEKDWTPPDPRSGPNAQSGAGQVKKGAGTRRSLEPAARAGRRGAVRNDRGERVGSRSHFMGLVSRRLLGDGVKRQ